MNCVKWNENWKFWPNKDSFALIWNIPDSARDIDLPHDAMIEKAAYAESLNGSNTGYRDGDVFNYAKILDIPKVKKIDRYILKIDGAYMNAVVYVNGEMAAKNMFGYSEFYADLTEFLKEGENEVRIQVRAGAMTNSRWYTGAGLYRDVYLLTAGPVYIEPSGIRINTEDAEEQEAVVLVNTCVRNRALCNKSLKLSTVIYSREGEPVASDDAYAVLFAGENRRLPQRIAVSDPKLWNDSNPYLYTCKSILSCAETGEVMDETETVFGIRTLSLDAKRGLRVNGKSVKLRGACIHHDSGLLGAATYYDAHKRQIKKMKAAGFNAVRMSHHPMAPALLNVCDEEGMYVMDEAFDIWNRAKSDYDYSLYFNEWWKKDIEGLIDKDYNHPSVIMYSIGNEIPEIGTDHGAQITYEMNEYIKSLDHTRYTTAGINGAMAIGNDIDEAVSDIMGEPMNITGNVNAFMTVMDTKMDELVVHRCLSKRLEKALAYLDVAGYNYMTARYEMDAQKYPNRVMVGSETHPPMTAKNWEVIRRLNSVIGDFTWTGWDYLGEAGIGIPAYTWGEGGYEARFPAQIAYCGDFDITGFRRPASYYREAVFGFADKPYITVQDPNHFGEAVIKTPWVISDSLSSWNWKGCEGKPVIVEVYAAADEAELFVNGKSMGRKPAGEKAGFITEFETVYEPGEVKAVAYRNGEAAGEFVLFTAKEISRIAMTVDHMGDELIYVPVELRDDQNHVVPDDDQKIFAEVSGGASIVGFGSGDPKPSYNFNEGATQTFHGRCLVILKKNDGGEPVTVTVKLENGLSETFTIGRN